MSLLPWIVVRRRSRRRPAVRRPRGRFNYRKVGPEPGARDLGPDLDRDSSRTARRRKVGYRLQVGGGTFVMPFVETVDIASARGVLDLASAARRCSPRRAC